MSPTEREFGRLEQKVDGLADQLARMEQTVLKTLGSHDKRIDDLESVRDEGKGGAKLVQIGKGLVTFALMLAAALGLTKGAGL